MKICGGSLNAVKDDASPSLWHKRLRHVGERIIHAGEEELVNVDKHIKLTPYEYCLFGKHHQVSFHSSTRKSQSC